MLEELWLIPLGFIAGILGSIIGLGGGIIFVPLMVVALGISMKRAAPTSQFILMFASFSGLIVHSMLGVFRYIEFVNKAGSDF